MLFLYTQHMTNITHAKRGPLPTKNERSISRLQICMLLLQTKLERRVLRFVVFAHKYPSIMHLNQTNCALSLYQDHPPLGLFSIEKRPILCPSQSLNVCVDYATTSYLRGDLDFGLGAESFDLTLFGNKLRPISFVFIVVALIAKRTDKRIVLWFLSTLSGHSTQNGRVPISGLITTE